MAPRLLGCLVALLTLSAACKGKGDANGEGDRCEQLAKACGDNDKHIAKIAEGCKAAATKPLCADKLDALFACYQKQLCGRGDRIWAYDDLGVLAERKTACATERKAVNDCAGE
jgi:hypothetical protein